MATAQSARPTSMSAAVARPAAAPGVQVTAPSRREFLNYIWIASMALLLGETSAGLIWFAFPRFKEGEFGGTFAFDPAELPSAGAAPVTVASGRFHISHTPDGLRALYQVCTHLAACRNGCRRISASSALATARSSSSTGSGSRVRRRAIWIALSRRSPTPMARHWSRLPTAARFRWIFHGRSRAFRSTPARALSENCIEPASVLAAF